MAAEVKMEIQASSTLPTSRHRAAARSLSALVILSALSALSAFASQAADIVAHRGGSHDAPENTMASFRLGWEQKADAVELDIHLSADGRIVVMHDADAQRTTGVPGKVADMPWSQLSTLDAGSWKDPRWKGERIPQLEQVIATVPPGRRLFIEIKCGPEILPELERVLKSTGLRPEQTVIIGFDYDTVVRARKRFPSIAVQWLSGFKRDDATGAVTPSVDELIRKARDGGLTGIDVSFKGPIDSEFVRKVKAAGLQCHVWTVNDPAVARRMVDAGVDSITTDRPLWLRQQLSGLRSGGPSGQ